MGAFTTLISTKFISTKNCFVDIFCGEFYPNQMKNWEDTLQVFTYLCKHTAFPKLIFASLTEKFVLPGATELLDLSRQPYLHF